MKNKKYQFEIEENNVIRAAIAPMGIDFRPNTRFYMGDYICRINIRLRRNTAGCQR